MLKRKLSLHGISYEEEAQPEQEAERMAHSPDVDSDEYAVPADSIDSYSASPVSTRLRSQGTHAPVVNTPAVGHETTEVEEELSLDNGSDSDSVLDG